MRFLGFQDLFLGPTLLIPFFSYQIGIATIVSFLVLFSSAISVAS